MSESSSSSSSDNTEWQKKRQAETDWKESEVKRAKSLSMEARIEAANAYLLEHDEFTDQLESDQYFELSNYLNKTEARKHGKYGFCKLCYNFRGLPRADEFCSECDRHFCGEHITDHNEVRKLYGLCVYRERDGSPFGKPLYKYQ